MQEEAMRSIAAWAMNANLWLFVRAVSSLNVHRQTKKQDVPDYFETTLKSSLWINSFVLSNLIDIMSDTEGLMPGVSLIVGVVGLGS